jgi:glyoxylase-like metal-dependent hydrolase (beta-lactamase superfamily II)
MNFGRLIRGIVIGVPLITSSASFAVQPPTPVLQQAPGFYRGKLGQFEITALSDGVAPRDLEDILSEPALVHANMANAHEKEPVPISINAFLINTGSHLVLVDTGAGELFGATSGRIVANIKAAGYTPEQIDSILLTHIHGDHSGGLTVKGERVFPNATVYVSKLDVDYWLSDEQKMKAPENKRQSFDQSQLTVTPYVRLYAVLSGT